MDDCFPVYVFNRYVSGNELSYKDYSSDFLGSDQGEDKVEIIFHSPVLNSFKCLVPLQSFTDWDAAPGLAGVCQLIDLPICK